ncbi:hypothetical protein GYMLUDRAFT_40671 [Collybiopsis luxurians FD-317 M1]|uniref:Fe2OG dioxygenase domain-containing protein n=1 Tax=Collybiopsis luxurians FD-317 M1 TaxID=944289 RepID=A0A0D0D307_9AGAR|nr:hypothetical protein GYMLUDRAFT_40671 [Collybiopsis luxurians FD-317 M1]
MSEEQDNDILLALVSSLTEKEHSTEVILDTLVQSKGDPQLAAQILNRNQPGSDDGAGKRKRKRTLDLDGWLKGTKHAKNIPRDASSPRSNSASPSKASTSSLRTTQDVDLMTILKQPSTSRKAPPRKQPLTLSSPEMVAEHTPCTMHLSALPSELASRLFYTLEDSSKNWQRNKWWLFDRLVESPHKTAFFVRKTDGISDDETWHESAQYWYNGRKTDRPETYPPEMEEACQIIERLVTEELRKRPFRYSLEWAGGDTGSQTDLLWRANVAASNRYEGRNESVGWHSDQMTYLGPYCTIASLSLGTRRIFSLREVIPSVESDTRSAQTFNIPLPHNSLVIMHASCQERFKHAIPPQSAMDIYRPTHPRFPGGPIEPSNCRINVTFRFYRPDFKPASIPRCKCDIPTVLRADMKNRIDGKKDSYWWACFAGAQNNGKTCNMWKIMDMEAEGRGPTIGSMRNGETKLDSSVRSARETEDIDGTT